MSVLNRAVNDESTKAKENAFELASDNEYVTFTVWIEVIYLSATTTTKCVISLCPASRIRTLMHAVKTLKFGRFVY